MTAVPSAVIDVGAVGVATRTSANDPTRSVSVSDSVWVEVVHDDAVIPFVIAFVYAGWPAGGVTRSTW